MNFFQARDGELCAEEVRLADIAERVGTPCYVYSLATLRRHYRVFDHAFGTAPHLVCYSVKANSNLAVLDTARAVDRRDVIGGPARARVLAAIVQSERDWNEQEER